MPSPQATPHRDDLGSAESNACRQAVLPIIALAPIALEHRTSINAPPTVDLEITNGRGHSPLVFSTLPLSENLGAWICKMPPPPPPPRSSLSLLVCRAKGQAKRPRRAIPNGASVACCFSDGVVISPAGPDCGERQQIPSPGAGGRQRKCKCQKIQSGMHPPR